MPKRLLAVVALLLTASLAACGDDDGGGGNSPRGSAQPADVTCDYPADDQSPTVKKVDAPPSRPTVGGDVPASADGSDHHLLLTPACHGTDGFFIAGFRRQA